MGKVKSLSQKFHNNKKTFSMRQCHQQTQRNAQGQLFSQRNYQKFDKHVNGGFQEKVHLLKMEEIGVQKDLDSEELQIFKSMDPKPKRLPKLNQRSFDANFQSLFANPQKNSKAVHMTHSETVINEQDTPNKIECQEVDFLDYLSGIRSPQLILNSDLPVSIQNSSRERERERETVVKIKLNSPMNSASRNLQTH